MPSKVRNSLCNLSQTSHPQTDVCVVDNNHKPFYVLACTLTGCKRFQFCSNLCSTADNLASNSGTVLMLQPKNQPFKKILTPVIYTAEVHKKHCQ